MLVGWRELKRSVVSVVSCCIRSIGARLCLFWGGLGAGPQADRGGSTECGPVARGEIRAAFAPCRGMCTAWHDGGVVLRVASGVRQVAQVVAIQVGAF